MHGVIFLVGVLKLLVLLPAAQGCGAAKSIVDDILIYITDAANNHTIAARMVFDIYFCFHKPYKFCFDSFSIANIHISVCIAISLSCFLLLKADYINHLRILHRIKDTLLFLRNLSTLFPCNLVSHFSS